MWVYCKTFYFRGRFQNEKVWFEFRVMVRKFKRNMRFVIGKEVFSFRPITVFQFRHTSKKGVGMEKIK